MEITPLISADFIVLQDEATVSELIGQFKEAEKRSALVFRKNKYLGLVEKRRLLKTRLDVSEAKVKGYVQRAPLINEHADVIETAYLMSENDSSYLPVERTKKIIGIIKAADVAKTALEMSETKKWKVNDIKLIKVDKINKDEPVSRVIELMYNHHIDRVPIFDKNKLFGILTYKDLLRHYLNWTPKRDISTKFNKMASTRSGPGDLEKIGALPVSDFSSNNEMLTIGPEQSLQKAFELMHGKDFSSLIVVKDNDVQGILTVRNILSKVGKLQTPINYDLKYIGLNELGLDELEKANLQKIVVGEATKIQRKIDGQFTMTLHFKGYHKDGKKQKYSVHLRLDHPGKFIVTSEDDWDAEIALRKALENAHVSVDSKPYNQLDLKTKR